MVRFEIRIPKWLDKAVAWPVVMYRKWKYGEGYRRIYLGEGMWTILDQEDYYRFNDMNWSTCGHGNNIYAGRPMKQAKHSKTIRLMYLHRAIMNAPKGVLVDHRNGNGLDNRQSKLRLATHSENCCNRPKKANTSSRFIGVCYVKSRRRYRVATKYHRKTIFIGYYKDEVEAAKAYDEAAKRYHGEFARLNFPKEN